VSRQGKPEEAVMAGDGGRAPDVSEQRAEDYNTVKAYDCGIHGGQWKGDARPRCPVCCAPPPSTHPASVLAALLAEQPDATIAALHDLGWARVAEDRDA
jgi:hypothetical protein